MAAERIDSGRRAVGLDAELDRVVTSGEPLAYIILFSGDHPGRVYTLFRDSVLIGRADDADVQIVDPSVSARHARIVNGPQGFEIEDLGSTNGTFVGNQRVARATLRGGDRAMVGAVELMFLTERPVNATIKLPDGANRRSLVTTAVATRSTRPPLTAYGTPPVAQRVPTAAPNAAAAEGEMSVADLARKVVAIMQFLRRRLRVILAVTMAGVFFGFTSILVIPPRAAAVSEVKLLPHLTSNATEDRWQGDQEPGMWVKGAERIILAPELIRASLKGLGYDDAEGKAIGIMTKLKVEETGDHMFRMTYRDDVTARPGLVEFMGAHVKGYIQAEIARSLREYTAKADFLREQVKSAQRDLDAINKEKAGFRQANADQLPEDAENTHASRHTLETRKAELTAQIKRLSEELAAEQRGIKSSGVIAGTKFKRSETYQTSLADVNRKLSEAYARGLKDGHPEVQALKDERDRLEALSKQELQAEPSESLRQVDPHYQEAQARVDRLQAELSASRSELGDTLKTLTQVKTTVENLPLVEERLDNLDHRQKAVTELHAQLFDKLKQAELQLNLEKVSAESRFDVGAPRLERPKRAATLMQRCGIGLMLGLMAAALVILLQEARRLIADAMVSQAHLRKSRF
jgi:hypothetical protein